jgi:hypothetical protein
MAPVHRPARRRLIASGCAVAIAIAQAVMVLGNPTAYSAPLTVANGCTDGLAFNGQHTTAPECGNPVTPPPTITSAPPPVHTGIACTRVPTGCLSDNVVICTG